MRSELLLVVCDEEMVGEWGACLLFGDIDDMDDEDEEEEDDVGVGKSTSSCLIAAEVLFRLSFFGVVLVSTLSELVLDE